MVPSSAYGWSRHCSAPLRQPIPEQTLEHGGKEYELALRFKRYYTPYDIKLIDFKHDKFQGTEKARNFSSLVILRDRATGAEREVKSG
ncbi:MAG: hypothetical protein CM1200mP29_02640 [Verrucomicrobiota bacterium]|nr:MAG: hypothetical protein CM1200mP29_02640 [Verrucomicrobiota bacterium]